MLMKQKIIISLAAILIFSFLFHCAKGKFDLQIDGKEETRGADVYIDGNHSGTMRALLGYGSHYETWLKNGSHVIEIKKAGYKTYREIINIPIYESEYYMYIELEKEMK
jgi:hypothetical protein